LLDKAFGNVWTNVPQQLVEDLLRGAGNEQTADQSAPVQLAVTVGEWTLTLPLVRTFGDVPEGLPLAYFNSRDRLSLALNLGNFAERYGIHPGDPVELEVSAKPR
jgi:S-adenosylmethionine hydrolase